MAEPEVRGLMMPGGGSQGEGIPLREYVEAILRERDLALHTLAGSQERALQALSTQQAQTVATLAEATEREVKTLAASHAREVEELKDNVIKLAQLHSDAHAREHSLTQTAVEKAEANVNDRLVEMNKTFAARLDALSTAGQLTREMIVERVGLIEKKNANMDGKFAILAGCLAFALVVVEFVARQIIR